MQEIKNNPQVYATQEGIEEIKNNPQVYTTQEGTKNWIHTNLYQDRSLPGILLLIESWGIHL